MDSQPINAMELYFLEHNCMVTHTLDLATLFGHAASEYIIVRKLEQYSVDEDRVSDEHLISLPLKEKREFAHEQDSYAYVTITPDLQMIVKDAHPGCFGGMEVDKDDELVLFAVYDAYGAHTLVFRFLRRETVGKYPPKINVADTKPQSINFDANKSGKVSNKNIAEAGLRNGRKLDHYENYMLSPSKMRPHLTPKSRVVDEEEIKPNPFKSLLLPPAKRKTDTETDGAGGPAKKK
jgi:hypothetical protein